MTKKKRKKKKNESKQHEEGKGEMKNSAQKKKPRNKRKSPPAILRQLFLSSWLFTFITVKEKDKKKMSQVSDQPSISGNSCLREKSKKGPSANKNNIYSGIFVLLLFIIVNNKDLQSQKLVEKMVEIQTVEYLTVLRLNIGTCILKIFLSENNQDMSNM